MTELSHGSQVKERIKGDVKGREGRDTISETEERPGKRVNTVKNKEPKEK